MHTVISAVNNTLLISTTGLLAFCNSTALPCLLTFLQTRITDNSNRNNLQMCIHAWQGGWRKFIFVNTKKDE